MSTFLFYVFEFFYFFFEFRLFSTFKFHQATLITGTNTARVEELCTDSFPALVPRCFLFSRSLATCKFSASWNFRFLIGILFFDFWVWIESRWNMFCRLTGLKTGLRSWWKLLLMNALALETEEVILRKNELCFDDFFSTGMKSACTDLVDGLMISRRFPVDLHSKTDEK